ncbi:hypothetical protein GCN74_05210 [Janthinobacterium sp. FT14W]|uniref:hypothetical protein n=1 Tax=Janthinobacterium sp. FT14W TaxID=2654253 RepID=UPI00126405B6|nr:hypothetical protein [Janthinobacterium sp. FT14W]KAB8061466.1 hypothetical protein GCN74_05210 [Janthinobacterium sp. FT14W]
MNNGNFLIFGMGVGTDHLGYIGWTQRTLGDEEDIISDLKKDSGAAITQWMEQAAGSDKITIFEIDSAPSLENARDTVQFWCQYYGMLGAKVLAVPG